MNLIDVLRGVLSGSMSWMAAVLWIIGQLFGATP